MNYWSYFILGLTTGGISCLAVQAGLLTSMVVNQEHEEELNKTQLRKRLWKPVLLFLGSKLVVHTAFGALLGLLGSAIALNEGTKLYFQIIAGVFLLATAANLLNVHPIFRYVAFQPPAFVGRMLKKHKQSESAFAPVILGALTLLIPCPVTQTMEITAISTGNPLAGALVMFSFVLGTSPLFGFVGMLATSLTEQWKDRFLRFAAYMLIFMGLSTINGVLVVIDAPLTLQKATAPVTDFLAGGPYRQQAGTQPTIANGVQKLQLTILNQGYSPRYLSAKVGVPVELTVQSVNAYSCATDFVFREFGIRRLFAQNETQTYSFTPTKKGKFTFACGMGMYTGVLEVL